MRDTPRVDGKLIALSADRLFDETTNKKHPITRAGGDYAAGAPGSRAPKARSCSRHAGGSIDQYGERTLFHYLIDPIKNTVARSFIED